MSVDVRDLSDAHVNRLARLLSRRPEYGIAIPSRRWLSRQEEKFKSLPSELLRTSNPFKRLVIRLANSIDPSVIDPRAVLCKTHEALNPFLIRRLFLAVAYEVTVYTDTLRSWRDRKDFPIISAFVGRVDAVAALWTEPGLYRECYGTPPFENHMVFVRSGCEACILGAVGANARVLADLRTILIDRVERRSARPDGRRGKTPRLTRFVEAWIDHLKEERAAKCRAMSDNVLTELRARRPQIMQWRNRRRKEKRSSGSSRKPVYSELRSTESGHRLSDVPRTSQHRRRTRNGIPVAMVDPEGAEEQRRMAMFSMTKEETEGTKSIFRPDSMCDYSQLGTPRGPAYDPTYEQECINGGNDAYDDDEVEEEADFDRDLEEEERSRSKVTEWYATRVAESQANLTADDTKSVMSMIHPAFQPSQTFSHISAAPSPLRIKKDRQPGSDRTNAPSTVWTDATVYTVNPSVANSGRDVPPVPRVPSMYKSHSVRSSRPRTSAAASPPGQVPRRTTVSSSVYSDEPTPTIWPSFDDRVRSPTPTRGPSRNINLNDSPGAGPHVSAGQRQNIQPYGVMRGFSREDNPFTRENTPRTGTPRSGRGNTPAPLGASRLASPVPSMSSSRGNTDVGSHDFEPSTPTQPDELWGFPEELQEALRPEDSLTMVGHRRPDDSIEFTPWGYFARKQRE
ncbi:hypothetical protein F4804DRAFT_180597 [Jackrogersella minutella]|nr:hypothetical protein F4804DRAFT_180597 [Jackrogersella minutella]